MKTYALGKQRAFFAAALLVAALVPTGMLAGAAEETTPATLPGAGAGPGQVESPPRETAAQLVDRMLKLPNYSPHPGMGPGAEDERTPLLRAIAARGEEGAAALVARLLAMPSSTEDPQGTQNALRWQLIRDIGTLGDAAIKPAQDALGQAKTPQQRREMVEVLGAVPTPVATRAILPLLADKDEAVLNAAISALTGRLGTPAKEGGSDEVLPALVKIAPQVKTVLYRNSICAAVRRVRKPVPPAEKPDEGQAALAADLLRERLKNDPSADVRFTAACTLTEFGDNSGLGELKKAALAMQAGAGVKNEFGFALDQLVPALDQATGQKFGPVPMNPSLSSSTTAVPKLEAQRQALLEKIVAWVKANP